MAIRRGPTDLDDSREAGQGTLGPRCETCTHWNRWADDREGYGECKAQPDVVGVRRLMTEGSYWCEKYLGRMRL